MAGVGYNDSVSNQMYIHDTWDYLTHTMEWGGSYSGRAHTGVTIVRLAEYSHLTTTFASDSGYAGNTFDIVPNKSIELTGIDVNVDSPGTTTTVDVWYKSGTSVGFENTAGAWSLLASGTGTSAGTDSPTFIDLPDAAGTAFEAGETYGIYVDITSYPATACRSTSGGPNTYENPFCALSLTTNTAQGSPAFSGSYYPEIWNGTVYYKTVALVPEDYSTIQEAIDDALDGGVVSVAAGTYYGNIDFSGKAIRIFSRGGRSGAILDGSSSGSVVTFSSGEGADSILDGLTITNGSASNGGGICVFFYSSPTITNSVVYGNSGSYGGGIRLYYECTATIVNTTVHDNSATSTGDGLSVSTNTTATIQNSIIRGNGTWDLVVYSGCTANYDYCDVGTASGGTPGTHNINADPLFADSANGDYHLTSSSPCLDVGNNSAPGIPEKDFEDEPRVWDGDNDGTPTVDMGADEFNSPDLVELVSFAATGYGSTVLVTWETASEIDTAGFHIWRSWKRNPAESDFVRITGQLIPASGSPSSGATYFYYDLSVVPGHPYCYRLEDISFSGGSTFHDSVVVRWWMPGMKRW